MDYYDKYYLGIFWLPDSQENQFVSNLYIDKEGVAYLSSLFDFHKPHQKLNYPNWTKIDLVYGWVRMVDSGRQLSIKLYDLHTIYKSSGFLNFFKYQSNKAFLSTNDDSFDINQEPEKYNILHLGSQELNKWISETGFTKDYLKFNYFESEHLYKQPQEITLFENDDYKIYIFFKVDIEHPFGRKSSITENIILNTLCKSGKSIKDLFALKQSIDRFLSVFLGKPYMSDKIGVTSVNDIAYNFLSFKNNLVSQLENKIIESVFLGNSQLYFENWFSKQEKLELFIKNFFSVYGQRGVLIENRFVSYVSAIENYYENNIESGIHLKAVFEKLISKSSISNVVKNISELSKIFKFSRIYHVHLEIDKKDQSFTNDEIIDANLILEFLIREIILREIGVAYVPPIPSNLTRSFNNLNKRC